ncbi:alpha/beta hydrolase family protein [Paraburkholderia fungorum]|uniref:Alpha/beta hydrolase family protein n=1 Tax=Paraburkholderia fungorum TaxID=134537 RepID=A0AAU8SS76_9BURK|nr:alpha/beta hydrolase [Paraburkholderia fungorum]AJZ56563.1 alpha/beta hydrolase family protein [Paraburkholderia fungorum]
MAMTKRVAQSVALSCFTALSFAASAQDAKITEGHFTTNDGTVLHYLEAGTGQTILMVPGWSQGASAFQYQLTGLGRHYHVISLSMRGHGDSSKPSHGYHMSRLSKDLRDFIVGKKLQHIALAGHSMGVSVIWGYLEQYGNDRVSKLIFIDQMPMITSDASWTDKEKADAGAILDPVSLGKFVDSLNGPDSKKVTEDFVKSQFTKQYVSEHPGAVDAVYKENLKFPRHYAAEMIYNHATTDWRDFVPTIGLPTLIFAGKASIVPWTSQVWVASQVKGARLDVFEENEGGSHFMFMENPQKFDRAVEDFLGANEYVGAN